MGVEDCNGVCCLSSNVLCNAATEAMRCEGMMMSDCPLQCSGHATYLVFRTLGIEHGDQHITIAVSPRIVGSEYFTQGWRRCLL